MCGLPRDFRNAAVGSVRALLGWECAVPCPHLPRCPPSPAPQVLTLMFAGHDTSATGLTRLFDLLHSHPHVMQRLQEEQVSFGCCGDDGCCRGRRRRGGPCPTPPTAPYRTAASLPSRSQAAVLATHGQEITEAALQDMPYADGVVRGAAQAQSGAGWLCAGGRRTRALSQPLICRRPPPPTEAHPHRSARCCASSL